MVSLISGCVFRQDTMPRYDPTKDRTKRDSSADDRPTMRDVSHTAPNETTANSVWGRGPEADEEPSEKPQVEATATPRPADD